MRRESERRVGNVGASFRLFDPACKLAAASSRKASVRSVIEAWGTPEIEPPRYLVDPVPAASDEP